MYAYGHLVAPSTTRPVDRNLPPRESSRTARSISCHLRASNRQCVHVHPPRVCTVSSARCICDTRRLNARARRCRFQLRYRNPIQRERGGDPGSLGTSAESEHACLPARVEPPVIVQRVTEALAAKIARQLRRFRAPVPPAWRHTYSLAFAITDYKLQGKTLPRLLLSLDDNGPAPALTLAKLYGAHLASGHAGRPAAPTADAGGHGAEEARG